MTKEESIAQPKKRHCDLSSQGTVPWAYKAQHTAGGIRVVESGTSQHLLFTGYNRIGPLTPHPWVQVHVWVRALGTPPPPLPPNPSPRGAGPCMGQSTGLRGTQQ